MPAEQVPLSPAPCCVISVGSAAYAGPGVVEQPWSEAVGLPKTPSGPMAKGYALHGHISDQVAAALWSVDLATDVTVPSPSGVRPEPILFFHHDTGTREPTRG